MENDQIRIATASGLSATAAFLLGAACGAAAGLLLAPRSGQESREKLKEYAKRTREQLEPVMEKGREYIERGREFVKDKGSAVNDALKAGRSAMRAERSRGPLDTEET